MLKYLKESVKFLLRSYPFIKSYVAEIEKMYAMNQDELNKYKESCFLKLFRLAYTKSPFYKNLYKSLGIKIEDIKSLDDIQKLPVITKDQIRKKSKDLCTKPYWMLLPNATSGTTGSPLAVFESWESIWREQAYFYCYRKRCGFIQGEELVSLRGNLNHKQPSLYIHLSHTLFLSSYNINGETVDFYYKSIMAKKPKAIEGYPSSLYNLACELENKNMHLDIPICFTSSETIYDYQRERISRVLGCQIFDHFGTTERTIRLSEAIDHSGYFEDPGYSINEYLSDSVITTSLINYSFPLIRYQINDVMEVNTTIDNKPCPIIVKSIDGRSVHYIQDKQGTKIGGTALTFIFKSVPHVRLAQFIQRESDKVLLNILPEDGFNKKDESEIFYLLNEKIGIENIDIQLNLITPEEIIYTKRNKFSYVISDIKNDSPVN
ncbi:MAG: phenylacetate--CoA ligase family protein [Crenarchaeota archaeon]|nr:phenylacetate--CoA ligase family protein [Thermoproteota archaeon]